MKHNIKIKDDILEIKVSLNKRKYVTEKVSRIGMPTINKLAQDFKLPDNLKLGECLHPAFAINNFHDACEGTWIFQLNKKTAKKTTAKKTTAKKTKKQENKEEK